MPFASSISPERRASLRRSKAEFDAAFDLVSDREDRSSPTYLAADASYRSWIRELDAVAIALLDDVDAFESAGVVPESAVRCGPVPADVMFEPADVDRLFSGLQDFQSAADLIGTAPAPVGRPGKSTPKSRAMGIVGDDRVARHWNISLGQDRQLCPTGHTR